MRRMTLITVGVVLGGIAGWMYWYYIGCNEGCSITSSAMNSTLYGTVMGGLVMNLFAPEPQKKEDAPSHDNENQHDMLRSFFGMAPKVDIPQMLHEGAMIIDVRTKAEFAQGHADGSINIPLDQITQNLHRISKDKPVITCCRSGARSGQATAILKDHGIDAHNGGSWTQVQAALKK